VKSSFNALDAVVIKDDFCAHPDDIRKLALSKKYNKPPGDTTRLDVVADCNKLEHMAMYDLLKPHLPQIKNNKLVGINVSFRYILANAQKKTFCHVDGCSYAGLLYLSKPEDCAGGTTIYRHKATGDEIYDKAHSQLYDFKDASQWEVISEIEMVYNRLVMYPGQLFHAVTPVFFGDTVENARLTQNVFIHREHDRRLR
jgi:hypothetical protein